MKPPKSRLFSSLFVAAAIFVGCGQSQDSQLASDRYGSSGANCDTLGLTDGYSSTTPYVPNPAMSGESAHNYLPAAKQADGSYIVINPENMDHNGNVTLDTETVVTGIDNYPYETFQPRRGNCAPRAFEASIKAGGHSDNNYYNPYLEGTMRGKAENIHVSKGHTYERRDPNTYAPHTNDVIGYDVRNESGQSVGSHAAIVTDYNAETGDCIVATGWESRPYAHVSRDDIICYYTHQ